MRYNKIIENDVTNGKGVCVSFWIQGCPHHCPGCFNPETWDFDNGELYTPHTKWEIIKAINANGIIRNFSILGGEPMYPCNIEGTTKLAKAFKEKFPEKSLWAWSGYTFDNYLKDKEVAKYLDVVVDGQFIEEEKNPTLEWKGSSNQRVINVKESLKCNKIIPW